jgi:hypothetical protein
MGDIVDKLYRAERGVTPFYFGCKAAGNKGGISVENGRI